MRDLAKDDLSISEAKEIGQQIRAWVLKAEKDGR